MSYTVSPVFSRISLNEPDTVKSILQNVAIILKTKRGTVPLYRQFGVSMDYLDKPMPVAAPLYHSQIREAIEEFEPRVEVINISFMTDPTTPGVLLPTVEVNIRNEQEF